MSNYQNTDRLTQWIEENSVKETEEKDSSQPVEIKEEKTCICCTFKPCRCYSGLEERLKKL